jgi:phosphatidylinositol kinase/protein kinase (PI-3  family)
VAKGIVVEKCKYMESKTVPLWLVFENIDTMADPIYAILKSGDDLRQDQLTLQMISIMDKVIEFIS